MSGKHQDELESQKNKYQEEMDDQVEVFEDEKRVLEKNAAKTMKNYKD